MIFNLSLGLFSFIAYLIAFQINFYLPDSLKYGWVYLIFIPAGVKLICIMLFGIWGTIGDAAALFYVSNLIFPDADILLRLGSSITSSLMTFISIYFAMRVLRIKSNLENLHFLHLPLLSLLGSGIHGFASIYMFTKLGVISSDYVATSLAIITGDFIGIFITLLVFSVTLKIRTALTLKNLEL